MPNPCIVRSGNVIAAFFGAVEASQSIEVEIGYKAEPGDLLLVVPIQDQGLDDDGIFDGDLVIVKMNYHTDELKPGAIVLAKTTLGLLVSHLYLTLEGEARFAPSNKDYESCLFGAGAFRVLGVIVEIIKEIHNAE